MVLFAVISKGIQLATTAIDNWIHRVEKANEAMNEAVGEYESAKSSLESVNSELEEQNKQLDELLAKDKLTYAEKGQLEELQKITEELLIQEAIEERRAEKASKEAAKKTVSAFNKQYGKYNTSREDLEKKMDYSNERFPIPESEDDVTGNIAALIRAKELLEEKEREFDEAVKAGADTKYIEEEIQYYIDTIDDYSGSLNENITDLQDKQLALEDEYEKAIEKRENGLALTSNENNIIDTYESISNILKMIYEYTAPNEWNNMEFSKIFATEKLEKTKEELVEMAKAGELTPETITSYKNLNEAIQNSELFLKDGQTAAQAFCDEIYGCIEATEEMAEGLNEKPIPLLEALSQSVGEGDDTYSDAINEYEQQRASLQSYLDKINNNTLESSDKLSLATEFGITGDSVDELRENIEKLMDADLDGIIKKIDHLLNDSTLSGQAKNDLRNLKQSIIDINTEAKKASPIKIDAEVSSLSDIQSLSTGLKQLGDIYNDVKDGKEFDWSSILNNESFTKEFGNLGDVYNDFIKQISDAPDDIKKCQDAFNELATAYIYAAKDINGNSIMGNLTEETKDATIAMLEQMGVENAKQFVEAQLAAKVLAHKLAVEELDFANKNSLSALQEKISGLLGEADAAGITTSALFDLIAQENIFANTSLNVGQKMAALQALAEAFGITADAALGATQAINLENQVRLVRHGEGTKAQEEAYAAQLTSKMQDAVHAKFGSISVSYKAPSSGGSKGGGSKGSSSKKEPQEIDWTANSIENLTTKIDLLNAKLEKSKSYKTQLKYLKQIRKETENLAKAYQKQADAYKKYWEKAASKISKSQKEMVMSGKTFSIKEYGEDTYKKLTDAQDAWKQYQEATIKAIETQQETVEAKIAEYQRRVDYQQSRVDKLEAQIAVTTSTQKKNDLENTRIKALKKQYEYEIKIAKAEGDTIKAKQLELELEAEIIASKKTKFDNIVAQYENRANRKGYRIQDIENKVSLIEAKGSYVNAAYYDKQYEEQKALAEMYDEEEKKLQTRLATIRKYSDEWYEALGTIQDIQDKENDALVTMEQLADKVNDVAKSLDDLLLNKFSTMISEADTLMALLGDNLVDDALGDFTDNGIAALGLIYSQMQAENEKGEQLRKQLEIIEAQKASYKDGETATFIDANGMKRTISSLKELKDLEDETRNSIQESSKAEYTYYKNIIDLMKERYEAERNYLDDLIEKKKELLEAEQDLHQYAKDIKEQTDSIASLQKQLAALSGDNSLEGQARRQKIEAQLKESKDTLAETEYDRLISDQETMLDNLASEYAEMLEGYMKDDESLFREGLAVVKENAALINEVTTSVADKWGMELSGEMESVVGNINLVDSTLNGIRSDLQDYFAATQGKKDGTPDTPASDTTFGGLSAGDLSSIITNIPHGSTVNHGGDSSTSTNREPDMMEGTGLKILNPVTIDPSTGKVIGTGQLVNIGSGKLVSLSSNDDDEIIRVDRGNGEIMELVKVETPPEWQNFGRSLLDSTVNTTPNFDAITRQIVDNAPTNVENTSNVSIENVSFSLPNVSNYRELMQEAQADPKFEGMIGHMIDTKLTGSNRLNKFRTKF